MRAFLLGFGLLLSLVDHSLADDQNQILGTWKLVSWVLQQVATKEISYPYGEHPRGVLIFTPSGRAMVMLTGEGRKVPQTDEERSAAFRSLVAYSGQYRLEGDKWILKPDVAWNEGWIGTEQVRYFRREGDRLYIRTSPQPMINFGNAIAVSTQIWDKEE